MTRIQKLREEKGMLQLQLSATSGVTVRTLGEIERRRGARRRKCQKRIREALALALGVDPSAIFTKEGKAR